VGGNKKNINHMRFHQDQWKSVQRFAFGSRERRRGAFRKITAWCLLYLKL